MGKKLTKEQFIKQAREIHGNKYDYSKVDYVNSQTKVCIICPIHGEFWKTPNKHLVGQGCPKCTASKPNSRRLTTEEFIKKAREIHGDKYDYSKVVYDKNNKTKVCIICPKHGEFLQTPNDHLDNHGCPECRKEMIKEWKSKPWEQLLNEFRKIHGDKYQYDASTYTKAQNKMKIICPTHGEFWMRVYAHLHGQGCPLCSHRNIPYTTEEFIKKAREVHGDKYDYSKVEYINKDTKIRIICPRHGEFLQTPHNHLNGQGCPNCINSKLENKVKSFLEKNNIKYISQYKNKEILGLQRLDFYLPKEKIAIECQGEQHFKPIDFGGLGKEWAKNTFGINTNRDKKKLKNCLNNGIKLFYYFENKKFFGTYENEIHNIKELEKVLII